MVDGVEPLELDGYLLWPDGSVSVRPENLARMVMRAPQLLEQEKLFVTEMTPDVEEYNRQVDKPLTTKSSLNLSLPPAWRLPDRYSQMDLDEYLFGLSSLIKRDELYEERLIRLSEEIALFKSLCLDDVLKTLIYIIEEFKKSNVVWGVGRGSSCSSYLLYLVGLHEVDPVRFKIPITDFLKTP